MKARQANRMRLAIVSTPRTGNNWLMQMLSRAYDLVPLSPANPSNVAWEAVPPRCVMILHWPREPWLVELLARHQMRLLSIARHPLDVLISILHFTLREATDGWLHEAGGNERAILGSMPCSEAFLEYACGPRAAALLDVTPSWWRDDNVLKVRYEDLLRDALSELQRVTVALGVRPTSHLDDVVRQASLPKLRRAAGRPDHYWQGQAGLWRHVLPAAAAERIRALQPAIKELGYVVDANHGLTQQAAESRWRQLLEIPPEGDAVVEGLRAALFDVRRQLQEARHRLARYEQVGPLTLSLALRFKRWAERFPALGATVKRMLSRQSNRDAR